jgi:hypothetical protein
MTLKNISEPKKCYLYYKKLIGFPGLVSSIPASDSGVMISYPG